MICEAQEKRRESCPAYDSLFSQHALRSLPSQESMCVDLVIRKVSNDLGHASRRSAENKRVYSLLPVPKTCCLYLR